MNRLTAWRALSWPARFLIVNQFGIWFGFFMVVPLIATHGTMGLGLSSAAIGLVLGVRTLSQHGLMFGAGLVADRIGLRAALLIGSAARTVSLLMLSTADGLWGMLTAISVFGFAGSLTAPATRAYLGIAAGELRPEAFGLFNNASVLGSALGPLVAIAASPLGFEVTCYLSAAVFAAFGLGQLFVLPTTPSAGTPQRILPAVRAILATRPLLVFTIASSGAYAVWNQAFLLLPLEATRLLGDDAIGPGAVFTLLAVTNLLLQFRLLAWYRRIGAVRAAACGIALSGLGFAAVVVSRAGWPSVTGLSAYVVLPLVVLASGTVVVAMGDALFEPPSQDLVARLSPPGQNAAAFGLDGFFSGVAATVVSPLVGWADDVGWRHDLPWLAPAVVCLVGACTALAVRLASRDADRG